MTWRIVTILFASLPLIADTCSDLIKLSLPHTSIESASTTDEVCRVTLRLTPTPDSDIRVEVWMPVKGWNGKFEAVGNGGWSGSINHNAMAAALKTGYATSSTDTGHEGSSARFALGHPEKLIDYAYRSEHEMTVAAKAIIAAFYGKAAQLSFWNGCSAGGKQALMEAQRYPEDFNGIVAGSPAANWTGRAAQSVWVAQAVHKDAASFIPAEKLATVHRAAQAACEARDGVIENPAVCKFDPDTVACKNGDAPSCLTPPQVDAARKIYSASTNPRTGKRLYAGLYPGSELAWNVWGGRQPLSIGLDYFRYVVFENPEWDYMTLDFDRDVARAEKLDHDRINALDPNLKPFFDRGGKLIQYHGWGDGQISPGNSIDYFQSVAQRLGDVGGSYRLFMVPGMGHCGGGEGATSFDAMPALESWVEQGKAPERIVAHAAAGNWTHPLCPHPQTAVYLGKGDPRDASNYVCRK